MITYEEYLDRRIYWLGVYEWAMFWGFPFTAYEAKQTLINLEQTFWENEYVESSNY